MSKIKKISFLTLILLFVLIMSGCGDSDQTNENLNTNQSTMELKKEVLQEGTGEQVVKSGDQISVHYTGTLVDGTKFDSSVDRGVPFDLTIGIGRVIPGWDQGIVGMKVGEKVKLTIPPELAYGDQSVGDVIQPNSTLIFEVELISIK